jgi:hypothetical protein
MKRVKLTYTSGSEVLDVEAVSNAKAIVEALRLANLTQRRTSVYRTVVKVEILEERKPY